MRRRPPKSKSVSLMDEVKFAMEGMYIVHLNIVDYEYVFISN